MNLENNVATIHCGFTMCYTPHMILFNSFKKPSIAIIIFSLQMKSLSFREGK